jgi:acyl-homoserine-lactone acylase
MSRRRRLFPRWSAATGALLAATLVAICCSGPAGAEPALSRQVTIVRDAAGIPHITARSFLALGYGEGWAFAQDNLCTFANDIVTLEGERSRYFGPRGLAVNYSAGVAESNLQSDLFWKYVAATGVVHRELQARAPDGLLPQVREVYEGWIDAYNAYLRSGRLNDPACKGKPWVRPINLTDMILRGVQITTEGSSQQFIPGIDAATPPASAPAPRAPRGASSPSRSGLRSLARQLDSSQQATGSNGIGIGSRDTRSGAGMVLANPHFPWRGTERFWMTQLDVPGQYDMEGGTLEGFPLVGIGFNRHIAWTHTVSTDRRFVVYQLALVPGHPTEYMLNGRPLRMGELHVTVHYGRTWLYHTFYTTRWGVVADESQADYEWTPSTAYAIDDITFGIGARAADEYFEMGRATSVRDLYRVQAKWLANPTFNTIAADDTGEAYYGDVGATPAVSAAEIRACTPAGIPQLVYEAARVITLDGATTRCAPADERGTPQPGIFSARQLPHLFRRDYVENSNDSYWLANPAHPLTGFSPIIGLTGTEQNNRTRLGNALIAARVAGTDGLGRPKFTIATLQRMWEGDESELARLVLPALITDCRAHRLAAASDGALIDLQGACAALADWNGTGRLDARGGWLFSVWADLDTDSDFYATPFNPTDPLGTPTGLNTGSSAQPLRWLADAVQNLRAHHVALDASYRQVQYSIQTRAIPIPGCYGESEGSGQDMGCFNAIYAPDGTPATAGPVNGGPYGQVNEGSSLVMTTELTRRGPVSEGILTYSQATDPRSRWYENMTRLYSEGRWVALPYTAWELRRDHPLRPLVLSAP